MLCLKLQAPFATFRTFSAGWHRPTAGFLTPTAVYGLLLNVAGIESRHDDGKSPMTLTNTGLPEMRLALGSMTSEGPRLQSVFQQLHNYPVGAGGGTSADEAKGNKNNITPVRREFLSDLDATVAVQADDNTMARLRSGLAGKLNKDRYGLPFLGDNSFLIDRLEEIHSVPQTFWYCPVSREVAGRMSDRTSRLTVWIDRADMSQTQTALYAPMEEATSQIPEEAWTRILPPS